MDNVLGSARTGLIFTRIWEGTQLDGLTQTGQIKQDIRYHVQSCWVPAAGKVIMAREHAGHQVVSVALCISLYVLYILLISIVIVTVCFICCFC